MHDMQVAAIEHMRSEAHQDGKDHKACHADFECALKCCCIPLALAVQEIPAPVHTHLTNFFSHHTPNFVATAGTSTQTVSRT